MSRQGQADLAHLDQLGDGQGTSVALYRPADAPPNIRRFKLFRVEPLSLTDILPIFTPHGRRGRRRAAVRGRPRRRHDPARLRLRAARTRRRGSGRTARPTSCAISSRARSRRSGTAGPSPTASTSSSSRHGSPGARSSSCARSRSTSARPGPRTRRTTSRTPSSRTRASPATSSSCGRCASTRSGMLVRVAPTASAQAAEEEVAQRVLDALDDVVLARPRPDHPRVPRGDPGRPAHELLPGRTQRRGAQAVRLAEAQPQGRARPAGTAPAVRDLGLQPAGRGRAPALRAGRPRRAALVRPARGLPHRDPRARQGADGQERRHRADRLQGRVLPQAPARPCGRPRGLAGGGQGGLPDVHLRSARHHRQPRLGRDRPARGCRAPRRRRPLPGGRRRQGHGDVLGHRQRRRAVVRLLARRRLRVRWLGRLRPQGHGHHGPRRVGVGQAPLPRDGRRHPERGLHRRRHRRHERRRLRQRHAALRAHPARRCLRPPARVRRPEPRRGHVVRGATAPVRAAALVVGRLRPLAGLRRRRDLPAQPEVDRRSPRRWPRRSRCRRAPRR